MTVVSKQLFDAKLPPNIPCMYLFHPWTDSCIGANTLALRYLLSGVTKFFLPIYLVKALIGYKKLKNKSYLVALMKELFRSVCYGLVFGGSIVSLECLFHALFGPRYYVIGMLVGAVSALSVLVESPQNKILDTLVFCNLGMEAVLRGMDYFKIFSLTNKNQTLLFCAVSSCVMYLFKTRKEQSPLTHFWFYVPATKQSDAESDKVSKRICSHEDDCKTHIIQGVGRYFVIGYMISIVKSFLGKFHTLLQRPTRLLNILLNKRNMRFGMFTAAYAAIYSCMTCYLANRYQTDDPVYSAVAGLLAGVTYGIHPNLQSLTIGLVTVVQLLYEKLKWSYNIPTQLPMRQMMFMLSNAILLHLRLAMPDICPKFYRTFLTHCSNGFMTVISKQLFDERMSRNIPCMYMFHPWTDSCIRANSLTLRYFLIGTTSFFVPIYLIKALISYKKLKNKSYLVAFMKELIGSVCYGIVYGTAVLSLECTFHAVFGPRYYLVGIAAGALSSLAVLIETPRNKIVNALLLGNLAMEAVFRIMDYFKILSLTNKNQTLLFSAVSSCVMYLFKTRKEQSPLTHFWFYVPATKQSAAVGDKECKRICPHEDDCRTFIVQGVGRYFVVGYMISIIKSFLGQSNKLLQQPTTLIKIIFSKRNMRFGMFTAAYATIYRCINCYLANRYQTDDPLYSAVAGLLAGITYLIHPNLQFLTVGLVTVLQLLYEKFKWYFNVPTQLPMRQMMFMLSNAILLHLRFVMPEICPKPYSTFLTLCSRGLVDEIHSAIIMNIF